MEDCNKVPSIQILIEIEVVKPHLEVNTKAHMVDIINMKVKFMEVHEKTLEEEEVMEVMLEIIKVNNQIKTQTVIIVGNLNTW
jgi:hypothetical protein